MCGISGIVAPDTSAEHLEASVRRAVAALHHRGPDASGTLIDTRWHCGLGHARLSIIDLSDAGLQPMHSADLRYAIVFNGEVYNFPELRRELEQAGRRFKSRSDTEVVLVAFEHWGADAFARLNGMFALAILDRLEGRLWLARDRLGIKPLFVARQGVRLAFASEIKALAACGLIDTGPDHAHLHEYLHFGNTLGEATLYRDVQRLPPAHYLTVDLGRGGVQAQHRYWSPPPTQAPVEPLQATVRKTAELLEAAVQRQLVSDVPVGVFLSGGIDSTAIVALATRHCSSRLKTYSVGFDYVGDARELDKARWVAERFGTEHHELQVSAAGIVDAIERTSAAHDQPFGDAANVPLYQLCAALQGDCKVILQGDGGDEIFGGYRRYEYLSAMALAGPGARLASLALGPLSTVLGPRLFGAQRFFHALARRDPVERAGGLLTVDGPLNPPSRILSPALRETVLQQDPLRRYREVMATIPPMDELQRMFWTDLQILLPDIFLEKVDRATMAQSIEVRVPFLDFDLVDFAVALPSHLKVSPGKRKKLLRMALRGIVPDTILDAPKVGFGVPVTSWLAGPLRGYAEAKLLACSGANGFFDAATVQALFAEHAAGRRDHGQLLWKALQMALWSERLGPGAA